MAVQFPTSALVGLLGGSFDLDSDDIRAVLLLNTYTFNGAHDFLDDITSGHRAATMASSMTGLSITAGVFDAADVTFSSVAGPGTVNAVYVYKHNASENAARLLCYVPIGSKLLNGSDIIVNFDAAGIFILEAA